MRSIEKMLGLFLGGWELVTFGAGCGSGRGEVLNTLQKIKMSRKGIKCAYIAYNGGIFSSFTWICLLSNITFSGFLNVLASSNQLFFWNDNTAMWEGYTFELRTNLVRLACVW